MKSKTRQYLRTVHNDGNEVEKGGHFDAWEQPALLAAELRAAFRPLRNAH